jgi:hypothetical protein
VPVKSDQVFLQDYYLPGIQVVGKSPPELRGVLSPALFRAAFLARLDAPCHALSTPLIFMENCATLWELSPAVSFGNTQMEYLVVRCVACGREFPVERIDGNSQAVHFQRSSFRASYTCPSCNATSDYTRDDLMPSRGHSSFVEEVRDGWLRKSP